MVLQSEQQAARCRAMQLLEEQAAQLGNRVDTGQRCIRFFKGLSRELMALRRALPTAERRCQVQPDNGDLSISLSQGRATTNAAP